MGFLRKVGRKIKKGLDSTPVGRTVKKVKKFAKEVKKVAT